MNDGFKITSITTAEENYFGCNRFGLMVNDAFHGRFNSNAL
jgi:hypothetical protein